ncbi:prolipoprotein diacylglyceryl transferase [Virgisporangium aurantiacum]|uniref:Phosphatidylglycerol--prolipoprotein diacylglyceryl transferase n=1 Tax=Virgisporangium aurantiacum TaxID=175570 RepID=A0A8J3ZAW4_9ACTN|nr:prolipoprotein diacylglyceryl transferase [Virgisporangium aurantiacum]GIJ58341.1 prolipoprotein diacylglyceryl transferase [Virgisporangium aurantiacum]
MNLAAIPSPTQSVWHLGPLPLRAYAVCIILGIVAACVVTEYRMRARGAPKSLVLDLAVWAVPAGIIGARIYHVITSPEAYFGADGDPVRALYIWEGGLGVWGSVLGGAVGAWIACRRLGIPLSFVAACLAPGLPLAQGIGRLGNWFNNELYGGATTLPWGLKVYEFDTASGKAVETATGEPSVLGTYHPAFLYELVWDFGVALLVWQLDKRFRFGKGKAFAVYVMAYCVGRFWIELMRTDPANHILGMRLNNWTAIVVFLGALIYFLRVKGPQEYLRVDEDGTITVIPAPGSPASAETGTGPEAAIETATDTDTDDDAEVADEPDDEPDGVDLSKEPDESGDEPDTGDSEPAQSRPGT